MTAVLGLDRPAVLGLSDLAVVLADHGLDGDGHAGDETGAAALMAVVRHFGVFVQLPAGAVAHELADDGEAGVLAVALDGIANVADAVAGHSLLDALVTGGGSSGAAGGTTAGSQTEGGSRSAGDLQEITTRDHFFHNCSPSSSCDIHIPPGSGNETK